MSIETLERAYPGYTITKRRGDFVGPHVETWLDRHHFLINKEKRLILLLCAVEDCFRCAASFGVPLCVKHRKELQAFRVMTTRDTTQEPPPGVCPRCDQKASHGWDADRVRLLCKDHAAKGMVCLTRKCRAPGCAKTPSFGHEYGRLIACADHKSDDMVVVATRYCAVLSCREHPIFGYPGGPKTRCPAHREEGMRTDYVPTVKIPAARVMAAREQEAHEGEGIFLDA